MSANFASCVRLCVLRLGLGNCVRRVSKTIMSGDDLSSEQQQEYRVAFDFFDREKKGTLSPEDYSALMKSLGEAVSVADARNLGENISFSTLVADRQKKW